MGTTFTNSFSRETWEQKYKFGTDNTIDDTFARVAKNIASVEKDKQFWTNEFASILENFQFVPGGRIISNAGTGLKGTTYINCFVDGFIGEDKDSIECIYGTLLRQAKILQSEGGYGFCCNVMRPRGSHISGIANRSPGPIKFLELWDKSSEIITAGAEKSENRKDEKGFIRKGAQMVTMGCWHPSVFEFISAKKVQGVLSKFNMSVLCTDEFMECVEDNKNWNLVFPDYEKYKAEYEKDWDGNIEDWIEKYSMKAVKIHSTIKARELWDFIMDNTYNRNEPGVLFIDTMNRMNNLWYCEHIDATNPCQPGWAKVLTKNGIRELSSVNIGDEIWSHQGWTTITNKWSTGTKDVYKYSTTSGAFYGTKNHKIVEDANGTKVEVSDADSINIITGKLLDSNMIYHPQLIDIMDGLVIGDGSVHKASNDLVILYIGDDDKDYFNDAVRDNIKDHRPGIDSKAYEIITTVKADELPKTYERRVPKRFLYGSTCKMIGFLRGLYSANGSICDKRVTLKSASLGLIEDVQMMLSALGIRSYYTINKPSEIEWDNGTYVSKQSYDLNITSDRFSFAKNIGFIQSDKTKRLSKITTEEDFKKTKPNSKTVYDIISSEFVSTEEVFDITVSNSSHTYWTQGCNVSNCGEQILPIGAVCLLGSLNLTQFVDIENGVWDYAKLAAVIPSAIRFMDNVNDVTNVPLKEQKENLKNKRRIGLGMMGYGSALVMLKLKYGSKEALKLTEELMDFIKNEAYKASALLAKEKGAFPLFDGAYLDSAFIKTLKPETIELIRKYGIRNSHLLSVQPNGNTGCLANIVSGGLEPIFSFEYFRTSIQPEAPEGLDIPKHVDWNKRTYESSCDWKWRKEGDEYLLITDFQDKVWKFDRTRGLLKEEKITDYGYLKLQEQEYVTQDSPFLTPAMNLDADAHINTMSIFAKNVDSAISKTINVRNDYPYEDFKKIYIKAWKNGVKGFTTYREGTMTNVLSRKSTKDVEERPKELPCDVHHTTVNGIQYLVLVGLHDGVPYEVFACRNGILDKSTKSGRIIKKKASFYKAEFENDSELSPITSSMSEMEEIISRLTSGLLRSGADMHFIVKQLEKVGDTKEIHSFARGVSRVLKKYIPDGTEEGEKCPECSGKLIRQEGCKTCYCGWSKCS